VINLVWTSWRIFQTFKQGSGDTSLTAADIVCKFKIGGLSFIPEFRLDITDKAIFVDSASLPATSTSQSTSSCLWF
jgi:hypothetical protein